MTSSCYCVSAYCRLLLAQFITGRENTLKKTGKTPGKKQEKHPCAGILKTAILYYQLFCLDKPISGL